MLLVEEFWCGVNRFPAWSDLFTMSQFYKRYLQNLRNEEKRHQDKGKGKNIADPTAMNQVTANKVRRKQIMNNPDEFDPNANVSELQGFAKSQEAIDLLKNALSGHYLFDSLQPEDTKDLQQLHQPENAHKPRRVADAAQVAAPIVALRGAPPRAAMHRKREHQVDGRRRDQVAATRRGRWADDGYAEKVRAEGQRSPGRGRCLRSKGRQARRGCPRSGFASSGRRRGSPRASPSRWHSPRPLADNHGG